MNILTLLLVVLHIAVSLVLILVVLLQTGKRADLAGAFGGGGSQTAFGARGAATFLSKATTISAVVFMAAPAPQPANPPADNTQNPAPAQTPPADPD